MKTLHACLSMPLALVALTSGSLTCPGAEAPPLPATSAQRAAAIENPVNYVLRVDWRSNKNGTNVIQLLTSEGTFKVNTSQATTMKLGESEFPISLSLDGHLKGLDTQRAELQLFLGRTVPYASRAGGASAPAAFQQRQEGLTLTFVVTFGKPVVIQKDGNGEISVLVEREKPVP